MYQHYLGSKSGLDEVADGHGAHERREAGHLRLLLVGLVLQHSDRVEGYLRRVFSFMLYGFLIMTCNDEQDFRYKRANLHSRWF